MFPPGFLDSFNAASFAFTRYDLDADGTLNPNEARVMFKAVNFAQGDAGLSFGSLDTDKNDKLSLEEWENSGDIQPRLSMRVAALDGTVKIYAIESADFGPDFRTSETGFHGVIQIADPIEACGPLVGHYAGRIVLVKRGACEFCVKAKSAQDAGAMAVVIANEDETLIRMTPGSCGQDVNIPSVMVTFSSGEDLQQEIYISASVIFPTCPSGSSMKPGHGLETCDDGNRVDGDGCSQHCLSECGNGVVAKDEECDDGNTQDWDGCSSKCKIERGLYHCSDPACCHTRCGDGYTVPPGCYLSGKTCDSPCV